MADLTSQIVSEATYPATPEVLDVLRLSVVDWMACGIAGMSEPVARVMADVLDSEGGVAEATCFGGRRRPARSAALFNGTVSHALDYDDTHFAHIGHLSVAVLPASIAMAERTKTTLGAALEASLAGCEAAIRMGLYLGRPHYEAGFHQTATSGAFGATLAASLLARADCSHALGLASTRAAGLKSQFGSMGKPFNAGQAASNGAEAALMAGAGIIADTKGWDAFAASHNGEQVSIGPKGFLIPDVMHKYHACCHGLHAALDAVASLSIVPDQLKRIEIATHPRWMGVCNKKHVSSGLEAKFSYGAVIALLLLGYDTADPKTYLDDIVRSPKVQDLAARVVVIADRELSELQAVVRVGSQEAKADLAQTVPFDHRLARLRRKARALVGADRSERIFKVIFGDLDKPITDLTTLM